MMLLFLLLLLSIPEEIVGIKCVCTKEIELLLYNFTYNDSKSKIDADPCFDYSDMCRVQMFVDYNLRKLFIYFADSFEWSQLDDREGRYDFLTVFNQTNTEV